MDKLTIRDIDVAGKTVLITCRFQCTKEQELRGEITDEMSCCCITNNRYLLDHSPKAVVLFSHLGKIRRKKTKLKNDMAVVAPKLAELLGRDVKFIAYTRGAELEETFKER